MPSQFVLDNFFQGSSAACLLDVTAPTFGGITGLSAPSNGSVVGSWSVATDATGPISYDVFIQAGTATGLFNILNRTVSTFSLSRSIFSLADGSLLLSGVTYFVGVRARDAVGNVDANLVSQSAVSLGVPATSVLNAIDAIWDQVRSSHVIAGTFGHALQARVDVDVSTRNAIAPDNAGVAAIKAKTDNLPSDPASNTQVATRAPASTALDNAIWTNAKAAFVDVAVSTRNSVVPDNAGVTAIKAKTDNLPADPASNTQVATRAASSTALDNTVWTGAKAAFVDVAISTRNSVAPDNAGIATLGVDMATSLAALSLIFARTDVATSSRASLADITAAQAALTALVNAVAANVWDQLLTAHVVAGSFGLNAQIASESSSGGDTLVGVVQSEQTLVGVVESEQTLVGEIIA